VLSIPTPMHRLTWLPGGWSQAQKEHYYLLEMCYIVNVVLALYVWVMPNSVWMYKAAFGLVAGPLTWSIVALRNSLVMHGLDQARAPCPD